MAEKVVYVRAPRRERTEKIDIGVFIDSALAAAAIAIIYFVGWPLAQKFLKGDLKLPEFKLPDIKLPTIGGGGAAPTNGGTGNGGGGGGAPSPGKVVYTSASWGPSRNPESGPSNSKFGNQDPQDKNFMASHAGAGCSFKIGGGVLTLGGDRCRAYLVGNNYNSMMEWSGMFVDGKGDFSMRLRSRHNEGGAPANRFGGYGCSIEPNGKGGFAREDYHNVHNWSTGDKWQIVSGTKGQWFKARFAVQDQGSGVTCSLWILEGNSWVLKARATDPKPNPWAHNRSLIDKYSYSWIRTNGGGKIAVKDLRITEIGPL